jgi:hypothetical protein
VDVFGEVVEAVFYFFAFAFLFCEGVWVFVVFAGGFVGFA